MKLLFDQNLSPKLTETLSDVYPGSGHVSLVGLDCASDEEVWTHARENGYAIVTKDADFDEVSQTRGYPPNVIWLRLGNCTTNEIESIRFDRLSTRAHLHNDPDVGVLTLL